MGGPQPSDTTRVQHQHGIAHGTVSRTARYQGRCGGPSCRHAAPTQAAPALSAGGAWSSGRPPKRAGRASGKDDMPSGHTRDGSNTATQQSPDAEARCWRAVTSTRVSREAYSGVLMRTLGYSYGRSSSTLGHRGSALPPLTWFARTLAYRALDGTARSNVYCRTSPGSGLGGGHSEHGPARVCAAVRPFVRVLCACVSMCARARVCGRARALCHV